jgi:predicted lipoprotein with Yx(FWY)xxD motif
MRTSPARLFGTSVIAMLALAACGSSSKSSSTTTTTQGAAATATTVAAATTTTAGSGTATAFTVSSAQNATIANKILVDGTGLTLYVSDNDKTANKSECALSQACIQAWPPLFATGTPTYGSGLTASMFSTVTTANGTKFVVVNGKPLYTWVNDEKPGDVTGQGVNGFYVVGVDGQKIDNS